MLPTPHGAIGPSIPPSLQERSRWEPRASPCSLTGDLHHCRDRKKSDLSCKARKKRWDSPEHPQSKSSHLLYDLQHQPPACEASVGAYHSHTQGMARIKAPRLRGIFSWRNPAPAFSQSQDPPAVSYACSASKLSTSFQCSDVFIPHLCSTTFRLHLILGHVHNVLFLLLLFILSLLLLLLYLYLLEEHC